MAPSLGPGRSGAAPAEALDRTARRQRGLGYGALAFLAYVPALFTAPGRVAADTKQYLYLDPDRMLSRAPSMWDPNIGLGTVTHQNIGYLFPMGPYYWLMEHLGFPDWVAQRLWLGSLLFFAGLGVLYLLRTLGVHGPGSVVAALAYMLSPYSLHYAARISVILLPWAGLPWMIALVARALRRGDWRYPAAFALVVQIVGGVNATALVFALIGPALWIPYAVWVAREVDWRRALATVGKIGALTLAASLWWIAGLWAQGSYGINILRYTETVKTVSTAGVAPEVLRGLGYWFFYGGDKLGQWIEASVDYTQRRWLILASYAVPTLALLAAAMVRWRHRLYFALLALVGLAIAVGTHPYGDPSPFGAVLKAFADRSSAGLALRSVGRAVPLVALGLAVLLGVGVTALVRRLEGRGLHRWSLGAVGLVGALVVMSLPALWNDTFYGKNLQRPEEIPEYWTDAATMLDEQSHDTRVLEIPGSDFASYRWGNTVDPITPGLMDRPYVARELIPYGAAPSNDLLNALDRRLQEGLLDPDALAPIARLMGVGDVLLRSDLQVDRYNLARPRALWALLDPPPAGLGAPASFGDDLGPPLDFPLLDERALALPAGAAEPPPVAVFPVEGTPPIVHTNPTESPLLVAGDGEGLVDLAGLDAFDGSGVVLYSASYGSDDGALRQQASEDDAVLVVTDSNRRRGRRWSTVRENLGYTERAGEVAVTDDPSDARLDVFPDASDDAFTVTEQRGGALVTATSYGNRISYTPEDRPTRALDGDLATAWRAAAFAPVEGERIVIELDEPVTTDHMNLVQPLTGDRDRWITRATVRFDGGDDITVDLDDTSRTATGQTVNFEERAFSKLEIIVEDDNIGPRPNYIGTSGVGFAEVRLRDQSAETDVLVDEVVRMPTDLTTASGTDSSEHRLVYVMSRSRTILIPPRYSEDELELTRAFDVPTAREFEIAGWGRLSTAVPDELVDTLLGLPDAAGGGITARSSQRLPGSVLSRASSAADGDPATGWTSGFGAPAGQWVELELPQPATFDRLDLQVVADGRHSVPTRLRIEAGGESRSVDLPGITDQADENATVTAPVTFPSLTGSRVRITVEQVREVVTQEYFSDTPIVTPVAFAELGLPGAQRPALPAALPDACRADLLTIDGEPVPVRLVGPTAAAEALAPLELQRCDPTTGGPPSVAVRLERGEHLLRSAPGAATGLDLDGVVVGSEAGGAPLALGPGGAVPPLADERPPSPEVEVIESGRTEVTLRVQGADSPFWLVLGQSQNDGWQARVAGDDIGGSRLVDGYANGWRIDPPGGRGEFEVTLSWTPQRRVWTALGISGVAMLLCTVLALGLGPRRRNAAEVVTAGEPAPPVLVSPLVPVGSRPGRSAGAAVSLGAALVAGALVAPPVGLLVGALVLVALVRPRWRIVLAFGAPVALGLAGLYVLVQQSRHRYPSVFEWPTFFDRVHVLGWLAVVLLAADALVETIRTRR